MTTVNALQITYYNNESILKYNFKIKIYITSVIIYKLNQPCVKNESTIKLLNSIIIICQNFIILSVTDFLKLFILLKLYLYYAYILLLLN